MHFDNDKEFVLIYDASPYGQRTVLSHETQDRKLPTALASHSLTSVEKNFNYTEKEALALVLGGLGWVVDISLLYLVRLSLLSTC